MIYSRSPEQYVKIPESYKTPEGVNRKHNLILSSIRKVGEGRKKPDVYIQWIDLIEKMHPKTIIALTPGLDERDIQEAKKVLNRLMISFYQS